MTAPAGFSQPMSAYAPSPLPGGKIDASEGGAIPNQGIYDVSATPNFMLGTQFISKTGKIFRYAQNGATAITAPGLMQQGADTTAALSTKFLAIAQTVNFATAFVGATEITVDCTTGSSVADNYFAGGKLVVKTGAHILGDMYDIVASKIDANDTNLHLLLSSPIRTAFTATSTVSVIPNQWAATVVAPTTTLTAAPAGVPVAPYNTTAGNVVPASYYYWAQTRGDSPAVIDTGDTVVVGNIIGLPTTSAVAGAFGAVVLSTTTGTPGTTPLTTAIYGTVRYISAADGVGIVFLTLE